MHCWYCSLILNLITDLDEGSSEIIRAIAASNLSFKYDDLRKATDNFSQNNRLGEGGYGAVYKVIFIYIYI